MSENYYQAVLICEFLFLLLYDILYVLCFLLHMFVHFMPFIVYVCTALLPIGVIKNECGVQVSAPNAKRFLAFYRRHIMAFPGI